MKRIVKALSGFLFGIAFIPFVLIGLPFLFFFECYRYEQWPWEV